MLYKIWTFIQLLLPYWVVIQMYKHNKALPVNIKTRTGRTLKAIMVTTNYGILFDNGVYILNRGKHLQQQQKQLDEATQLIAKEINNLTFEAREELFNKGDIDE